MRYTRLVVFVVLFAAVQGERLVAFGDTHGDYNNTVRILKTLKLIDTFEDWIGGDTLVVQTGDTCDRGPHSYEVVLLMRRLQMDARRQGGDILIGMGNHELMVVQHDLRYLAPRDNMRYHLSPDNDGSSPIEQWLLNGLNAVNVAQDMLFSHGGVMPEYAELGVDEINRLVRTHWRYGEHPITGNRGPLWNRIITQDSMACFYVNQTLSILGLKRQIVGHTIVRPGTEIRCDGQLIMIDTAISDYMRSNGTYNYPWTPCSGNVEGIEFVDDVMTIHRDPNDNLPWCKDYEGIPAYMLDDDEFPMDPNSPEYREELKKKITT